VPQTPATCSQLVQPGCRFDYLIFCARATPAAIAPLESDNLLEQHPDVAAALCAGVPDERLGEVVHAVIVPRAGAELDAVALRDWLLARTERFKVPDVFHFRDVLPSGSSGNADRQAIALLAAQAT
jgi:long-chain acyl-CoA synthetase